MGSLRKNSKFPFGKVILFIILVPLLILGVRTYTLYQKFQRFDSYHDAMNFLIQHKTTFVFLYECKCLQTKLYSRFYPPMKKTTAESLSDWIEERMMRHIKNHDKVNTVRDLPLLERSVIKALDGSSCIHRAYQRVLYYFTRSKK